MSVKLSRNKRSNGTGNERLPVKNYTLRRALRADANDLASCIAAACAVYDGRISDLPNVSEGIEDDIANRIVWVAERDSKIVGGLILSIETNFMLVMNVAVHLDASGAGIGRALMDKAEEETRKCGLLEMRLSTHVDMPENVALYEHLGWQETDRSGHKVRMMKTLP